MFDTFEEAVAAAEKLRALDVKAGRPPRVLGIMKHVGDSGHRDGDIKGTGQYAVFDEARALAHADRDRAYAGVAWVGV